MGKKHNETLNVNNKVKDDDISEDSDATVDFSPKEKAKSCKDKNNENETKSPKQKFERNDDVEQQQNKKARDDKFEEDLMEYRIRMAQSTHLQADLNIVHQQDFDAMIQQAQLNMLGIDPF